MWPAHTWIGWRSGDLVGRRYLVLSCSREALVDDTEELYNNDVDRHSQDEDEG